MRRKKTGPKDSTRRDIVLEKYTYEPPFRAQVEKNLFLLKENRLDELTLPLRDMKVCNPAGFEQAKRARKYKLKKIHWNKHPEEYEARLRYFREYYHQNKWKRTMTKINETEFLKVLALALPHGTPDHRVRYLLKKLYGQDSLSLDVPNTAKYEEIKKIAEEINGTPSSD